MESHPTTGAKGFSPLKRIRAFCLECMGGSHRLVRDCADVSCHFHPYRFGRNEGDAPVGPDEQGAPDAQAVTDSAVRRIRIVQIIRRHCLACVHNDRKAVRECTGKKVCVLWPCRFGVKPGTVEKMRARRRRPRELALPGLEGLTSRKK